MMNRHDTRTSRTFTGERETPSLLARLLYPREGFFGGRGGGLEQDYRFGAGERGYDPQVQPGLGNLLRTILQGGRSFEQQVDPRQQFFALIDRLQEVEQERNAILSVLGVTNIGGEQPFNVRDIGQREVYDLRDQLARLIPNDRESFAQLVQQYTQGQQQTRGHSFRGVAPKNVTREDNQIKDEVITRLTEHDDIDPTEVDVQVKGGEVTLTGNVDDRNTKLLMEQIIGNVIGVKDVVNQIRVSQQTRENGTGTNRTTGRDQRGTQTHAS